MTSSTKVVVIGVLIKTNGMIKKTKPPQSSVSRCINIDILRLVGLFCVVLAHVDPPMIIHQIRNFDVPLMVIVSGMAFSMSSNKTRDFVPFAKKRFLRLICPCYLFLCLFFLYTFVLFLIANKEFPFSAKCMIDSFLLLHGIGYVWIIRVFIIVAMMSFFIKKLSLTIKSDKVYLFTLLIVWLVYEIILYRLNFYHFDSRVLSIIIKDFLLYAFPYGIFFAFGVRLSKFSNYQINTVLVSSFVFFIIIALFFYFERMEFIPTQNYKYPPQLYYGAYSIFASLVFFKFSGLVCFYKKYSGFISNISSSTMWIYLWHIFILYNIQWASSLLPGIINFFPVKLFVVIVSATIIAICQKMVMLVVCDKLNASSRFRIILEYSFLK